MKKWTVLLLVLSVFIACEKDAIEEDEPIYVSGMYSAVEAQESYGWKGFLTLEIDGDSLISVVFDYKNDNDALKSETNASTYPMAPHPSVWLPVYESKLIESSINPFSYIDAISGATIAGNLLNNMADTLLEAAKVGDFTEVIIE